MYSSRREIVVETRDSWLPLPHRVKGRQFSYSDHEAVCARLRIVEDQGQDRPENACLEALEEAVDVCNSALSTLKSHKRLYWVLFSSAVVLILSLPHYGSGYLPKYLLAFALLVLALLGLFFLVMATAWNRIERHGILAAKLGMTIRLKCLADRHVTQ